MEDSLTPMLLATWNVNSLRARLPRVLEFLDEYRPDALLLQETKCAPEQFPHADLEAAGWRAVDNSGGRWCGVAILVPIEAGIDRSAQGLPGQPEPEEARWIEATLDCGIGVVSVYVPNGREVDSVHFERKLEFLDAAASRVTELALAGPLIVGGDMNVAPTDLDVWDPNQFTGATHVTAQERLGLERMRLAGSLFGAHVERLGDEQLFTWWDYRGGSFHRGFGMRIDHFLLSRDLADRIEEFGIAREYRKGEKPSDHVPVVMRLAD
jgi:exodeoxyribonuclease-3